MTGYVVQLLSENMFLMAKWINLTGEHVSDLFSETLKEKESWDLKK